MDMATSMIKGLKIATQEFVLNPTSLAYSDETLDVSYDGYIPISVGYYSNQANCSVWRCNLDGNSLRIGRYNANGLSSNTMHVNVIYIAL